MKPLYRRFDHALDIGGAGDVGFDRNRLRALGGAFGGDRLRIAFVGDDEPRPFVGEEQGGRAADAGAAAGDNANLVLQAHGPSHSYS